MFQRKRAEGGKAKAAKKAALSANKEEPQDSGAESDGYGEEGLSWEAVLATVQVSPPLPQPQPPTPPLSSPHT